MIGFLANLFFGGGADKKADIPALVQGGALVVDVRTAGEFSGGYIDGAVNIPYDIIAEKIGDYSPDKNRAIIVYCRSGSRSAIARKSLKAAGCARVVNGGSFFRMKKLLGK